MAYREDEELPEIVVTPGEGEGEGTGTGGPTNNANPENLVTRPPRRQVSKELAELEVRGKIYTNWTSVRVESRITEAFPTFQFECTEEVPVPLAINGLQFVPGDVVRVFLGGHQVIFGYILERHVGYDARNHGVRLIGSGNTVDLVNSMVPPEQWGNHDGKNVLQLAQALAAHLGIPVYTRGAVDPTPFDNIQVLPGETPINVVERYARMRDIDVGSLEIGGQLLIGDHPATSSGSLWEAVHILRANCVVRDPMVYRKILGVAQDHGSDKKWGDTINKMYAQADGSSTRNRYDVVVADVADIRHGIEQRVKIEKAFTEGSEIEAHITVQGWFKDNNRSDDIWRAGEYYIVDSPSLILNNALLGCKGCVYEQNNQGGTTTTLQMVKPIHMHGMLNFRDAALEFHRQNMQRRLQPRGDTEPRQQP